MTDPAEATAPLPAPRVDGERLVARLTELRGIGAAADGGVTREAYGSADVAGRDLVAGWMAEAGLAVEVDGAANLIGRRAGTTGRWLASGSHLDTVVDGGWLDGAYGVVAAVEVAAALAGRPDARHGLAVVAYANEEGARGTQGMAGSRALVGQVDEEELATPDDDGVTLRDRIAAAGAEVARHDDAAWDLAAFDAVVELHIEQGPVLDATGTTLGAVTAITGRQALDVEVLGAANHAGATPMELRHDALAAAAEVVLAIEALPATGAVRVATVGHVTVGPNVRNVVPGRVALSAELRDEDAGRLDAAMALVEAELAPIAEKRGVALRTSWGQRVQPTACDPAVLAVVRRVCAESGRTWTELPSGAGHDAQILGREIPMAMVFVPSRGGLSHTPHEDTAPDDLVAGAQALLDAIVALDDVDQPDPTTEDRP
ncbi:Zn-dependent hydrolase [Aquihabitans sp. G128]|uniref:Zn-dependent hydrolase n=1 Tax=Aquihabitans sp. G128 TaxID=2849779 RepID=UPI001C21F67D|nr:Zn-dependent hydrolase [Aquihabitans sp. G128]QXC61060.1 Zn-dependent hydrolase [Aquihabitans sp. G128]